MELNNSDLKTTMKTLLENFIFLVLENDLMLNRYKKGIKYNSFLVMDEYKLLPVKITYRLLFN